MAKKTWSGQDEYDKKHFTRVNVKLGKPLVAEWRAAIAEEGIKQAEFVREAILRYLHERKGGEKK